jgi:hypothetical protein
MFWRQGNRDPKGGSTRKLHRIHHPVPLVQKPRRRRGERVPLGRRAM